MHEIDSQLEAVKVKLKLAMDNCITPSASGDLARSPYLQAVRVGMEDEETFEGALSIQVHHCGISCSGSRLDSYTSYACDTAAAVSRIVLFTLQSSSMACQTSGFDSIVAPRARAHCMNINCLSGSMCLQLI